MADSETPSAILVGVEEEFLLIDAETGKPAPRIAAVLPEAEILVGDQAQKELHQAQIEHATSACDSLDQLRHEILDLRRKFVQAAKSKDSLVLASGTYPGSMGEDGRRITRGARYQSMADANSILAREQLICGCHIHVSIGSAERAIAVMNQIRAWLPSVLALSANSPFWEGEDTGFDSYRAEIWTRWPTSGPPGHFDSYGEYQQLLNQLVDAEIILDKKMAYWDVRPSESFPTLEIRVADVMTSVDDVVAIAGLARGLVATFDRETSSPEVPRAELLRAANWRAARSGLSEMLLSPISGTAHDAVDAIEELLHRVSPVLEERGELGEIQALVEMILARGNGATRQRAVFSRRNRLSDVLESVALGTDGEPRGSD